MKKIKMNFGFTITELIIVVIIIGIIAGFAIPLYSKSIERAHEKDAITQLSTIHAANEIYNAQNATPPTDSYWPTVATAQDLPTINSNLGLAIFANGMTYTCTGNGLGTAYSCTAVRNAPAATFTITVTQAPISSTNNPQCTLGTCP